VIALLTFPNKKIRAEVIKKYLQRQNKNKVVCFSCGNASKELKKQGLDVLDISPYGKLTANEWFSSGEITELFPDRFNATSGYLPFDLMLEIGLAFKNYLGDLEGEIKIPCGSGETLLCLSLVYNNDFIACYDNSNSATTYDKENPLNVIVQRITKEVIIS
jgi:hypothetical protein